jgi:hypothetical protein
MLNSRKLFFSPIFKRNYLVVKNFSALKQKSKIEDNLERELTNEEVQALEAQTEGFQKLVDFLLKREKYSWEDYRQQIIVNFF